MENELIGWLEMFATHVWPKATRVRIDEFLPLDTGDWVFDPDEGAKAKKDLEGWLQERGFVILRSYVDDGYCLHLLATNGHIFVAVVVGRKRYDLVIV